MESEIGISCLQCSSDGITMLSSSSEIPYFGEFTQITLCCDNCGWKHTDFIPSDGELPGYCSLILDSPQKMEARVVRSSSCTVRLPELDLEVIPGGSSSGFVTNVEGLINRFEDAIGTIVRGSLEGPSKESGDAIQLLERLSRVKSGNEVVTVELLDPRGRSQIIHDQANQSNLDEKELQELPTGVDIPISDMPS